MNLIMSTGENFVTSEMEEIAAELYDGYALFFHYNNTPLSDEDYLTWASYPYWSFNEALLLLIDINPRKNSKYNIDGREAAVIGKKYGTVIEIFNRSFRMNAFNEEITATYSDLDFNDDDGENDEEALGFRPKKIIAWFHDNDYKVPQKLYAAVMGTEIKEAPEPAKTAKSKAGRVINKCIENTDAAIQMADKRWESTRVLKKRIKQFIENEATNSRCTCLPRHMLDLVMETLDSNGKLIADSRTLSEAATLKFIKELFETFGINRHHSGRPPKNTCLVHTSNK